MIRLLSASLCAFLLLSCNQSGTPSGGAAVLPPPKASPKIFKSYSDTGDAKLAGGWVNGFDMSGVSFNQYQTCTLITPRHVIMAKHYPRALHARVVFHDRSGKICERFLVKRRNCIGDTAVGLLNQPVPEGYTAYPLPSPRTDTDRLQGLPIAVTDRDRNIFFHQVRRVTSGRLLMMFDTQERHGWAKKLISGDSGNPSFLISGGRLILTETHQTGGPGAGPYLGDPELQASIKQAVRQLDPSYRISTASVF